MNIESEVNINNIDLDEVQALIKEVLGEDWELDQRSAITKSDTKDEIHCHIFVQHIPHHLEHPEIPPFIIYTKSAIPVRDQLRAKIIQLKRQMEKE
jgi:hypothetical protein